MGGLLSPDGRTDAEIELGRLITRPGGRCALLRLVVVIRPDDVRDVVRDDVRDAVRDGVRDEVAVMDENNDSMRAFGLIDPIVRRHRATSS